MASSTDLLDRLHKPLQEQALPELAVQDLACLACTCRSFRELVMTSPATLWLAAAQRELPWHPPVPPEASAVFSAVGRQRTTVRNLQRGDFHREILKYDTALAEEGCDWWGISPDRTEIFYAGENGRVCMSTRVLTIHDLVSGKVDTIQFDCQINSASWQTDGRHISVMLRMPTGIHKLGRLLGVVDQQSCLFTALLDIPNGGDCEVFAREPRMWSPSGNRALLQWVEPSEHSSFEHATFDSGMWLQTQCVASSWALWSSSLGQMPLLLISLGHQAAKELC